jgi:hypothetical protein
MYSTLRPGFLVSVKTSVAGNVRYKTFELEQDHVTVTGERKARWETERTITDPEEHERAIKARGLARSAVQTVCAKSAFGLLCPEANVDKLNAAVAKAREITESFNSNATLTRVHFNVLVGRIAPDDVEAVKAINSEIRDLMDAMASGLAAMDVKVVREAAIKAKSVSAMLDANASERVQKAISVARAAACAVVKAGEAGVVEIDEVAIQRLVEARTSFLDVDDAAPVGEAEGEGRGVDLGDIVTLAREKEERVAAIKEAYAKRSIEL